MTELLSQSLFFEIAALLVLAAVVGFIGHLLRQPLIVSFIAVGIIAGPSALNLTQSSEKIAVLSELGIAVLLFLVGLKLDVKLIKSLGAVALSTGLGQVAFTAAIGFLLCLGLGYDLIASLYIAVALTFSSTIIIVKLLSDKHEVDSLHGQIALGFLIVQDIVVVLAMIALSAIGLGTQSDALWRDVGGVFIAGGVMLIAVMLFIRFVATPLTETLARRPELLLLFAVAQAAAFAALSEYLGFGKELGGLLAGISLASTPYREAVAARLAPLRDFLLLFFFIALGSKLQLDHIGAATISAIVLSLFVLIGNPLIVMAIMGVMGYRKRTGFLAGLTVAQISEFSLIFMAMGVTLGHVDSEALGLVTLVGLITIAVSTYMITYSHELYRVFEPFLSSFERAGAPSETAQPDAHGQKRYDALIFGLGRYGEAIASRLEKGRQRVLCVDFNPSAVKAWQSHGGHAIYGDVTDPEFVDALPLSGADWVISAIADQDSGVTHDDVRLTVIAAVRQTGFKGRIAIRSRRPADRDILVAHGADIVLEPFQDAADRAVELLQSHVRPLRFEPVDTDQQKELRE
ncbi:MAG: cation:proton antiporter [Hyphomicrobium sp.]|nr:cation:proton antiporter [Hyphomicrobium sp.]